MRTPLGVLGPTLSANTLRKFLMLRTRSSFGFSVAKICNGICCLNLRVHRGEHSNFLKPLCHVCLFKVSERERILWRNISVEFPFSVPHSCRSIGKTISYIYISISYQLYFLEAWICFRSKYDEFEWMGMGFRKTLQCDLPCYQMLF